MFSKIFKGRAGAGTSAVDAHPSVVGSTSPVLPELEPHNVHLGTLDFDSAGIQPRTLVVRAFGRTGQSSPSSPAISDDDGMSCHSEHTRTSSEGSSTLYNVEVPSMNNISTGQAEKYNPNKSTISLTGYIFNPETNRFEAVRIPPIEKEETKYTLVPDTPRASPDLSKTQGPIRKFPLTDHDALEALHSTITVATQPPKRHLRRLPAWHGHRRGGVDTKGSSFAEPRSQFLSPKRVHQVGLAPAMQNIASVFDVDSVISLSELLSRGKGPLASGERVGGRGVQVLL